MHKYYEEIRRSAEDAVLFGGRRESQIESASSLVLQQHPLTIGELCFSWPGETRFETYQLEPVHGAIFLYKLSDFPIFHKLRDDFVLFMTRFRYHHRADKREDIRVVEVSPCDHFLAKCLDGMGSKVSATPTHRTQTTDSCELPLPSFVI